VGKRPEKPVVIPVFKPPRNLSPAAIGYLFNRAYEKRLLTATLVEMAVKGAISIHCEKNNKYVLVNKKNTERLLPDEQQVYYTLLAGANTLEVNDSNYNKFNKAGNNLEKSLKKQWDLKDYIQSNARITVIGGLLVDVVFLMYILSTGGSEEAILASLLALPFISAANLYLLFAKYRGSMGCALAGCLTVPVFITIGVLVIVFGENSGIPVHWPSVVFFAFLSLLYCRYAHSNKMFTPEGAKLMSELEGFKMYMETAEEHRLNML
jgi:hypothetical protein